MEHDVVHYGYLEKWDTRPLIIVSGCIMAAKDLDPMINSTL